jgi:hypothetical protein
VSERKDIVTKIAYEKNKTSSQEILAFIDAACRLPNNEKKELWVNFLVTQFELRCQGEVIKSEKTSSTDSSN